MTKRTTLILDDETSAQLADLTATCGSQTAAIRDAIQKSHALLQRTAKRQAFIESLINEYGEPGPEAVEWAQQIAEQTAAAKVRASR